MMYTKDWAFIHIPKTSGVNLKRNAQRYVEGYEPYSWRASDITILRNMHNPYWFFEPYIKDLWSFSIVRNPYQRIVSQYLFYKKNKWVEKAFSYWLEEDIINAKPKTNRIWQAHNTQRFFLLNSNGKVIPEVFKMETDLPILEKKLGFTFTHTTHNKLPPYEWKDYISPSDKKNIEDFFLEDFEEFGY